MAADDRPSHIPETKPNPDPTIATNEAVERAMKSERDYVDGQIEKLLERLHGMDTATRLLSETAKEMPNLIQKEVSHLDDLVGVKFGSIEDKLAVAEELRKEQKADSKTGLDAALAAQKEAAHEQNVSNTLAISKSEQATAETIKTNQELTKSTTDALTKTLDEVKTAITRLDATKAGNQEQKVAHNASVGQLLAIVGGVGVVIAIISVLANLATSA